MLQKQENFKVNVRYFSFGARFNGLRYTVFVKHSNTGFKTDASTLLGRFPFYNWSFMLFCIFVLAMALKATGFKELACFWVLATMMEQGELKRSFFTRKNKHLIVSWLFAALLIRTIYTSDIYSFLTKTPKAKDVPDSFNQLVLNNSY